jgi:hypothetical protein
VGDAVPHRARTNDSDLPDLHEDHSNFVCELKSLAEQDCAGGLQIFLIAEATVANMLVLRGEGNL